MSFRGCWLALWLCASSAAWADEPFKPIAVFSFASVDECAADLDLLGAVAQNDKFAASIIKVLNKVSGVKELRGLDKSRPWGAALLTDGLQVVPLAFVPVADAGQWLSSLEPVIGKASPVSEGLWKIGKPPTTGFVRQRDGWAFIAQSQDRLESPPQPMSLLGTLPTRFDAAIEFNPQDLPESLRTMAIDQIRLQLPAVDETAPAGSRTPRSLSKLASIQTLRSLDEILSQCRQVTAGWRLDRGAKKLQIESLAVPLPNSQLAARWSEPAKNNSPFGNLAGPQTCAAMHAVWPLDAARQASFAAEMSNWRQAANGWLAKDRGLPDGATKQVVQQVLTTFFDLAGDAARGGRFDAGFALQGQSPPFTAVAVLHAPGPAAGDRLRASLREIAKLDDALARVRIDEVQSEKLRLHFLELPGLAPAEELRRLLGGDLTLRLAETPQGLIVAVGKKSRATVDALAASPPASLPPFSGSLKPGTLLGAAGGWIKDERLKPIVTLAAANLQKGDPEMRLTAEPVGGGLRIRIEAGEGVLRGVGLGISLAAIQYLAKP